MGQYRLGHRPHPPGGGREVFGLTSPLLTTSDGRKMGKTAGGAMWLDGDMLSPYEFWQFWRNTTDADTGRFLRLYTELPVDECARLGALAGVRDQRGQDHPRERGHHPSARGRRRAGRRGDRPRGVREGRRGDDLPTLDLAPAEVAGGISVVQLIVRAGLAKSGKEAKRLIAENGARLDDAPLTDAGLILDAQALASPVKLSAGRKRHALVRVAGSPPFS